MCTHPDRSALRLGKLGLRALLLVVHERAEADAQVDCHGEDACPHGLDEEGARLVANVDYESKHVGPKEHLHGKRHQ